MSELPEKWASCPIGDTSNIIAGGTPPSKDSTNFTNEGGIPWITPSDLSGYKDIYIRRGARNLTEKGLSVSSATLIPAGSVLFSSRAPVGYVAIASNELTTNQGFKSFVIPGELLDSRFVYFYLRHIKPIAEMMATGTTFKELSASNAAKLPLLIAPLNEQKRIAEKLDSLLTRVDVCQTHLARVLQILKRFRQSVLAAAMSGRLTKSWRRENQIESDWQTLQIFDICEVVRGASPRPAGDKRFFGGSGTIPWITVGELTKDTRKFLDSVSSYVTDEGKKKSRYIEPGTLLLTNSGATLGVPKITEIGGCINDGSVALLGLAEPLKSYLYYVLLSKTENLRRINKGAAQPNLNTTIVKTIEFDAPSSDEQYETVLRIEALLTIANQIEVRTQSVQTRLEQLTPSLLAKAFRGELVAQDENDESASELLERIRIQRVAQPNQPKRKPKSKEIRETKMTEDTVKKVIQKLPNEKFSFDELHEKFPGDYERLKKILFTLLDESDSIIAQVFDQSVQTMRFVRRSE